MRGNSHFVLCARRFAAITAKIIFLQNTMTDITSKKPELLAPAGNMEKLKTAFHFGADAVYLAGKKYGLRAYSDNFTPDEIAEGIKIAHSLGKKVYVTLNVFAKNSDFEGLDSYLTFLEECEADGVLISDLGVFAYAKSRCKLPLHVSTQANTTNAFAVKAWRDMGASRVVLARELSLGDIEDIHAACPDVELECFVHGAMCISYSGRCLLSNYLTHRDGNRGECVQACRWKWTVREISREDNLPVEEDERGTYVFNSKDLNLLPYLPRLIQAGVCSFKIEGRMKSPFYVATAVNAYRRALDSISRGEFTAERVKTLMSELDKASHRQYTTGFCFDEEQSRQYYEDSKAVEEYKFVAVVKGYEKGVVTVEQRNRFCDGDVLEVLSPSAEGSFVVKNITDQEGSGVTVANRVQQTLSFPCPYPLSAGDILRRKN